MKRRFLTLVTIIVCIVFLSGCSERAKLARQALKEREVPRIQTFALDTIIDLTASGENAFPALVDAEKEIHRLENLFSVTKEKSEVSKINANAGKEPVSISKETLQLLIAAKEINTLTDGCFNITIYPIVEKWGFTGKQYHVPTEEEIEQTLPLVNEEWLKIDQQNSQVFLEREGMAIDLGGIAKGYISDSITNLLKEEGIESAILSLGGNISTIGVRNDGQKWKIAIQDPKDSQSSVGILSLQDQSIVTSGGYQRFFEEDGKTYHHIIDPKTGYPANKGMTSVTIICENGTKADGLSTSLFVAGLEEAKEIWKKSGDFEAVFVTEDKQVFATEGIAKSFEFKGGEHGYTYSIIPNQTESKSEE